MSQRLGRLSRAQQADQVRRIGVLTISDRENPENKARLAAFVHELQRLGWTEGQQSANRPTGNRRRTLPIVFTLIGEPVARGFVQSLAHPGKNITGFTNLEATTAAKWIELLKEIAPSVKRVAIIYNPATSPFAILFARSAEVAAQTLALEAVSAVVHSPAEIEATIKTLSTDPGASLIVVPDGFAQTHRKLIIELAARYSLPAVYPFRFFPNDEGFFPTASSLTVCSDRQQRMSIGYSVEQSPLICQCSSQPNSSWSSI